MKKIVLFAWGMAMLSAAATAEAVVCTSLSAGDWNVIARWSCGHIPVAADTVVIAHNAIRMRGNYTVAGITINAGAVLNDDGNNLTVNGNVIINGQLGTNQGGALRMRTAGATLSGTGTVSDIVIEIDAANIVLAAGSTLDFAPNAEIDVGANLAGSLTINGTVTATTQAAGSRVIRVSSGGALTIGTTGVVNAPNSRLEVRTNASVLNNGNITVRELRGRTGTPAPVFTQGANSNLTLSIASCVATSPCTFNASAAGNTVTYNGTSTVIAPTAAGYWNLAGTIFPGACPVAYTIGGTSPCPVGGPTSVTLNPSSCVNVTGIGTLAWGTPANAVSSNNVYTTVSLTDLQVSNYLRCTGYGFAIPVGATINGVTVRVERKASNTGIRDAAMRLVKDVAGAPTIQATDRSTVTSYTTADVIEAHGGAADLWGGAWTTADINLANFGAAFASQKPGTAGGARTVSVDHMPITVTYTSAATSPHHIRIDHDGVGQTCRAETLTVTACANAACTAPHFTAATVTGNVTWAGSPGGSLPFTITSGGTGQTTVLLPVTTAQTVTLATSFVSPAETTPPSTCTNSGGGAACSVIFSSASACFDAVEVGAAISSPLFTKLSGAAFSLDVLASATYSGTLTVELVNGSTGSCATYASLSPANSQTTTFTSQTRKTLNFNYANAARDVKVRITGLAASSCSTGRFAIRPQSLTLTSSANADATGTSVSATPVVKAGSVFSLIATVAATGYDGTPVADNAKLLPHSGAVATGTLAGVFSAANPATGVATGSNFTYSEVGYFKANVDGIYDDTFAAIDSAAGDCINVPPNDFSNTLVGGKYGCKFGNTAVSNYFGRFVPDHFVVTPADFENRSALCSGGVLVSDGTTACAPTFTYMGEQMDANFLLTAATPGGAPTQNYTGTFAKLNPIATNGTLALAAVDATAPTNMTARLDTSLVAASGSGSFSNGNADISVPIGITRDAAAKGPYTALDVGIAPVDSDGVTTVFDLDINNDTVMDYTQINAANLEVRYGRARLSNAHGSELLPLGMPVKLEYWNGTGYATNADDTLSMPVFTLGNYTGGLNTGETILSAPIFVSGVGQLMLSAPGSGNSGSVDVTATSLSYLPGDSGRATFGVYKGSNEFIYLREAY